ncbi:cupin domain-containing protein [Arcobacter sp.]|uniref:cupin domain-containing protein n=1 Tax=Arcobacter sp. TaxID=1872629 RepID=UPI003C7177EA
MTSRPLFKLTEQINNERTCVNHLFFPSQCETLWHRHERDYVIVPMQDCELLMDNGEGFKSITLKAGECYYRDAGVEHNVVNPSNKDITLIEVEFK